MDETQPNMATTSTTALPQENETIPAVISYPLDKHRRSFFDVKESEMFPPYFTQAQLGKLEDKFAQRKWPDEFTIQMIALECNMLERHVTNWYEARRLKWKRDMIKHSD